MLTPPHTHSDVKYISKKYFKYYFFGVSVLYFTIYIFDNFYFHIPKENDVLFTAYILFDPQKYLLHFECLAGQEKGPIHSLIKRTSLVIPGCAPGFPLKNVN
jgi:hypothetical protein